ncbi:MAG: PqqD family peptide modification chaperone [Caldilineaceae bacterium]|nr:PqqD family peptide modification chaperone [Caldilineaceae bacterium]
MSHPPITLKSVIARQGAPLEAEVDGEVVLLGLEQEAYYGLAGAAQAIWQAIARPVSVQDICADLTRRYAVEPALCAAQTCRFLESLRREGLAVVVQ